MVLNCTLSSSSSCFATASAVFAPANSNRSLSVESELAVAQELLADDLEAENTRFCGADTDNEEWAEEICDIDENEASTGEVTAELGGEGRLDIRLLTNEPLEHEFGLLVKLRDDVTAGRPNFNSLRPEEEDDDDENDEGGEGVLLGKDEDRPGKTSRSALFAFLVTKRASLIVLKQDDDGLALLAA